MVKISSMRLSWALEDYVIMYCPYDIILKNWQPNPILSSDQISETSTPVTLHLIQSVQSAYSGAGKEQE